MSDIDKMMTRISALLAKADSSNFPEEAATYRAKAEELMRTYRIEEEQLIREAVSSGAPIFRKIWLGEIEGNEWLHNSHVMFSLVAQHCGVEYKLFFGRSPEGKRGWEADVVGYEIDIRLLEMIFNSARLAFYARLEPQYDPSLTDEENIYWLRGSGMDRQTVARKVFGESGHAQGIKVGKVYRAECEKRGEVDAVSGRGFSAGTYREAYASSFQNTIAWRLRKARDAADSTGGALVLPQRAERVKEAFYAKYPNERPPTPEERERMRKEAEEAACSAPPVKIRPRTKAEQATFDRLHNSSAARRARAAGAGAAESVDLVRQAPQSQRTGSAARTPLEG